MSLSEFRQGEKLWELSANRVDHDRDAQQAHLEGITVRFWEEGQLVSTATAPMATLDTAKRDIQMRGGIRVTSAIASTSVQAEEVSWQAGTQELLARGGVRFQRGPSLLQGETLRANRSLMRVWLGEPVRARFRLEERP